MGFWNNLIGGGTERIVDAASSIGGIVDKFVETSDEKTAARIVFNKLEMQKDKFQIEINKIQATHRSIFIAGARPGMMWVCTIGMSLHYVVNPIMLWIMSLMGKTITAPNIDIESLMPLVISMLGIGAMRSWEKGKGVSK